LIFCIPHYRDIQSADTTGITGRSPIAQAFFRGWAQDQKAPLPGVAPDMGHGRIARFFARYCLIFIPALYCLLVFVHALFESGSMQVAGLSILAAWVQLFGYGLGFLHAFWKRLVMKEQSFTVFEKNFYK